MSNIFRGGIPYSVDVRRLIETFPVPSLTEGRLITHTQLEEAVNSPRGSQRYYGVVNSWIARMRAANGIYMIWEQGAGILVLDPAKLLEHAETKTRQKIRQTNKAVSIHGWVDRARLNSLGQRRFDHNKRVFEVLREAMQVARKELPTTLSPIQSLPKPKFTGDPPPENKEKLNDDKDKDNPGRIH